MTIADLLLLIAAILAIVALVRSEARDFSAWAVLFVVAALVVMGHGIRA